MAHKVDRVTPKALDERMTARWRALVREAVGDTYRASNRRAGARIGIDLGALGNRV